MRNRMYKITLFGLDLYIGFFPGARFPKWVQIYR